MTGLHKLFLGDVDGAKPRRAAVYFLIGKPLVCCGECLAYRVERGVIVAFLAG